MLAAVLAGTGGLIAQSAGSAGYRSVVYATHARDDTQWRVLDPTTGRYRTVEVGTVSVPTTDLRYAAVHGRTESLAAGPGRPPLSGYPTAPITDFPTRSHVADPPRSSGTPSWPSPSGPGSPAPAPSAACPVVTFLGWRGPDRVLFGTFGYGSVADDKHVYIEELDLRTGAQHTLTTYSGPAPDEMVVAPVPAGRHPFSTF